VRFFQAENLKDFSAEDLDLLQKEIWTLKRGVRAELQSRQRSCAHCGQRIGDCLQGSKYCSAWHRYLDTHHGSAPLSRLQFECKRALHRLKVLRQEAAGNPPDQASGPAEAPAMPAALRNLRIRQILKEFRSITGEALKSALRALRASGAHGA
jgi:hypothetical protein